MHHETTNFTINQKINSQPSPANFSNHYRQKQIIIIKVSSRDFMKYTFNELLSLEILSAAIWFDKT